MLVCRLIRTTKKARMVVYYTEKNHVLSILSQIHGSVWIHVLPYCFVNSASSIGIVILLKHYQSSIQMIFSPQGHGFIGLLVSFLVLNKLYIALERYNTIRQTIGNALMTLRSIYQLIITYSIHQHHKQLQYNRISSSSSSPAPLLFPHSIGIWEDQTLLDIQHILQSTIDIFYIEKRAYQLVWHDDTSDGSKKSSSYERKAFYLARGINKNPAEKTKVDTKQEQLNKKNVDEDHPTPSQILSIDPMDYIMLLRTHVYCHHPLELLEKMRLMDMIQTYCTDLHTIIRYVSTPIPFPMIQMGRTFLFLWIFTMPLALIGLDYHYITIAIFIFFITYGYIGLELISIQLLYPYGNYNNEASIIMKNVNDLNIIGMKDTIWDAMVKDYQNAYYIIHMMKMKMSSVAVSPGTGTKLDPSSPSAPPSPISPTKSNNPLYPTRHTKTVVPAGKINNRSNNNNNKKHSDGGVVINGGENDDAVDVGGYYLPLSTLENHPHHPNISSTRSLNSFLHYPPPPLHNNNSNHSNNIHAMIPNNNSGFLI